ncbi:TetR/AcrR family transcriptional regulator [Streptomyces sp. MZ04]|uniref:TetR/AcrR family transcriptional regulator n=1 Tax=Streptomyces sp. MZ04 TaxID=2559236 RepID=UPI001432C7A4|nr:TetR/AcrR family transcriptional regulator [Streptomyces sp. MZ04]
MSAADGPGPLPTQRRDALRNRKLLVEAAREAFAEEGLQAPLDGISRRAGVANATLYRHFPQRDALVDEVFSGTLTEIVTAGERAMAAQDAWTGLTDYLCAVVMALPTEGGAGCLDAPCPDGVTSLELVHVRHRQIVGALLDQGQKQGTIRPDVTTEDLLLALAVLGRALPALTTTAPGAWHRPLTLLLDGLRTRPAASLLPARSLTTEELDKVLLHPHRR